MGVLKTDSSLRGILKAEYSLKGTLSGESKLSAKLSATGKRYDIYTGDTSVIPKAFESQILETGGKFLTDDITVLKVPYWETSNKSDGMTVYIAQEVI